MASTISLRSRKGQIGRLACLAAALWLWALPAANDGEAQEAEVPSPLVHTNQAYIEEVSAPNSLDVGDMTAVFSHVFSSLPERVKVYPTENYYYFSFFHGGLAYAGNLRLDVTDRDKGLIDFTYFPAYSGWRQDEIDTYKQFGAADGVTVEKLGPLAYRVSFGAKAVLFELNDLSGVRPPEGALGEEERFLGPIFDESGIQFFLVYNTRLKLFHYVLNELRPVPDELYVSRVSDRIVIGRRTGYAYYKDDLRERKILIGVYQENVIANTYFDGPFDQLPDNFIKGEELREAIVGAGLAKADEIDRFGVLPGGTDRILIKPYISYSYLEDLAMFADCAKDEGIAREFYYECFVAVAGGEKEGEDSTDEPAGAKRLEENVEPPAPDDTIIEKPAGGPARHGLMREEAEPRSGPVVHTNQQFIEELQRGTDLDVTSLKDVFAMVLSRLPAVVRVYPTENYYYFSFHHRGMDYSGNIRLGVTDRDDGKVHFTYFPAYNGWRRDEIDTYRILGKEDGVSVEKVDALAYRVAFRGHAVVFELNRLGKVEPPAAVMAAKESYIGPVFDESGMQFYLVYNTELKVFHYILNEEGGVPDQLYASEVSERVLIGRRTGFAFYKDKNLDRKILIGVYAENSHVNNYLDGPFDQLPDNFIEGETLRQALVDAVPELKGEIDRYGFWKNGESRFLIGPYSYYYEVDELAMFDECATSVEMRDKYYYSCFYVEEETDD